MSTRATHISMFHSPPVETFGSHLFLWTRSPDESKLRHRQQQLEQSWVEVRRAVAGRDEAEHNLQLTRAHLGECRANLEDLSSELLRQQERSDRGEETTLSVFYP